MSESEETDTRGAVDPVRRAWLLTAVVGLVALGIAAALPDTAPFPQAQWVTVTVVLGFVLAELLIFNVEARNEAVSFTPSDIPLAVALISLDVPELLLVRVGAGALALALFRRQPAFKFALNLAAYGLEAMVASAALRVVLQVTDIPGLPLWGGVVLAMSAGLVVGGMTIATAIALFEGEFAARLRSEVAHAYLFHVPGAFLGAATAVPFLVDEWLALVIVLPVPLVWLLLRSQGGLMHQLADLGQLHDFSSVVGSSAELQEIVEAAVGEVAGHLRAGTAALVVYGGEGRTAQAGFGDPRLLDALPGDAEEEAGWRRVLRVPGTVSLQSGTPGLDLAALLDGVDSEDVLVAPLGDGEEVFGLLAVAHRGGAAAAFDEHDHDRLGMLARQLAVAVRKGQLHRQVQHEALHDALTGLPNRAYFEVWSERALLGDDDVAVFLVDLDRFKDVNDTLGHAAGDALLVEVSHRLQDGFRGAGLVARLGGDEFAVCVPCVDVEEARLLGEWIAVVLELPVDVGGTTVGISGSVGVAVSPDHGSRLPTVQRRADLAMYDAKSRHGRVAVFSPEMESEDSGRLSLLADLRRALESDDLGVAYQPQVRLEDGRLHGVEALARWEHPELGAVPPNHFVALCEQTGLIDKLTDVVLGRSLTDLRALLDDGHDLGLSVNVSAQSLADEGFPALVEEALLRAGVDPDRLTLEITERAMIGDSPRVVEVIGRLHRLGVHLSVDDFGTGFSSLVVLRGLPLKELKIDQQFVMAMADNGPDEAIVASTIALGRNLGLTVVAEGVENAHVQRLLLERGCHVAQGYGISRPIDLANLVRWLAARRAVASPPVANPSGAATG